MRRNIVLASLVSGLAMGLAGPAEGALITFEFGGQVTSITDASNFLQGRIVVGQAYSARYTFDSQAPDIVPYDLRVGEYYCVDSSFQMIFGSQAVTVPRTAIGVADNTFGDSYGLSAIGVVPGAFPITELDLSLEERTGTVFVDDSLPLRPPDLTRFTTRLFSFYGDPTPTTYYSVRANVAYIRAIPEPGTLLVLSLGLGAVLARRRPRGAPSPAWLATRPE